MPDRISPPRDSHRTLALGVVAAISTTAIATSRQAHLHAELVAVDQIPPDACVAFYGSGPCREHGTTIIGSTDAVALWPPAASRPALRFGGHAVSASTSPVSVTLYGVTLDMWGAAALEADMAVAFDIRADEGTPVFDKIRELLAAGKAVGLWDSMAVMPSFAIGIVDGRHIVSNDAGKLTNFITLEAALKHGLMGWEGASPGWWKAPPHGE